jgi:transposase-like protein
MTPETLRLWVRQTEIDTGDREPITSEAKERVRQLERENARAKAGERDPIRGIDLLRRRSRMRNETSSSVHRRE